MTDRRRNLFIILLVVGLLAASAVAIATKPTRLGLDLKGGVELVYEAQPTPKVPEITPQAVDDAITTIRKRTDALGVAEPEIQRSGANQISVALPAVRNAERAVRQVGTTAQLQFYDWEANVLVQSGGRIVSLFEVLQASPERFSELGRPKPTLYEAVRFAARARPKAEPTDVPPGGPDPAVVRRFGADQQQVRQFYDRRNDTAGAKLYLFAPGKGPDRRLLEGPAPSCSELLSDFEDRLRGGPGPPPRPAVTGNRDCRAELAALGKVEGGPPPGSEVIAVPQGIAVIQGERPTDAPASFEVQQHYVLEDDSELSGAELKNPEQATDPRTNEPIVTFNFTDSGRRAFAAVTKRLAERGASTILPPGAPPSQAFQRFAISLDNQVVSLATIDFRENPEGIDGRTGAQINGIGGLQETQDLAESLRIGALPVDLKLISNTQVSATLGKQALNQGLLAAGAGLLLTLLFLVAFYRVLGVVAGVALLTYAVLLYALVELVPITLTLPGIAGLILTLGVAADANIVIFERIKEEARLGASIPRAISGGYAKALRTIIDANVVTIGVAFILFMLATAGVKGFAFTLGVGTIVSLFTAVLATSAILGSLSRTRLMRSPQALGAGPERVRWRFDFMGRSKWFFSMSGLILVAGALAIAGLGIRFGIDFESGTRVVTPIERPASVAEVRNALPPDLRDARIQQVNDPELGRHVFQLSVPQLPPPQVEQLRERLDERFGVRQSDFTATSIGPTFGAQIARTALIAIVASLFLISIYIGLRFQFKFAVPVLIALAHDLLITAGVYALTEREVTTSTVAALLTILGYSLYDTIIVFDRIRENVPRMPRATFSQIVNRSMSEVLTRSLVTSFSTLIPITALMLFGGETLRDFGFALLVGVASGTYSSVFIASPVLTLWKEREPAYRRRRELAMEEHGGVVPAFAAGAIGDRTADEEGRPARAARRRERP
ncbi:MAG: protein translocase subunit SecD, partial [Actinomycetota bacterium]|nr:protein translocase subunit SecD [Actinomycetota bacterium]